MWLVSCFVGVYYISEYHFWWNAGVSYSLIKVFTKMSTYSKYIYYLNIEHNTVGWCSTCADFISISVEIKYQQFEMIHTEIEQPNC